MSCEINIETGLIKNMVFDFDKQQIVSDTNDRALCTTTHSLLSRARSHSDKIKTTIDNRSKSTATNSIDFSCYTDDKRNTIPVDSKDNQTSGKYVERELGTNGERIMEVANTY